MTHETQTTPSCPVCSDPISHASSTSCPKCGIPHHQDCWGYNEGCGIFGCGSDQKKALVPQSRSSIQTLESHLDNLPAVQEQPTGYVPNAIRLAKSITSLPGAIRQWLGQDSMTLFDHYIRTPITLALGTALSLQGDQHFWVSEAGQPFFDNDCPSRWVIHGVEINDNGRNLHPQTLHLPKNFFDHAWYHTASFPEIAGLSRALFRNRFKINAGEATGHVIESLRSLFKPRSFLEVDAKGIFDSAGNLKAVIHHPDVCYSFQ